LSLVVLTFLTRETIFAAVGVGISLALASLGLIFHRRLGVLRRELHVVQNLSKTRAFLGESIEGELTIRNTSRLAVHILAVEAVAEKALSFKLLSSLRQLLRPETTSSSEFEIAPLERGVFQISGFILTFADARGLFTGEVKYPCTDLVEVTPGMGTETAVTPLRLYGGSPEILHKASTGSDYGGTREFVPGDEHSRIE
jgi:uncharacterized protein (DUF58 family)